MLTIFAFLVGLVGLAGVVLLVPRLFKTLRNGVKHHGLNLYRDDGFKTHFQTFLFFLFLIVFGLRGIGLGDDNEWPFHTTMILLILLASTTFRKTLPLMAELVTSFTKGKAELPVDKHRENRNDTISSSDVMVAIAIEEPASESPSINTETTDDSDDQSTPQIADSVDKDAVFTIPKDTLDDVKDESLDNTGSSIPHKVEQASSDGVESESDSESGDIQSSDCRKIEDAIEKELQPCDELPGTGQSNDDFIEATVAEANEPIVELEPVVALASPKQQSPTQPLYPSPVSSTSAMSVHQLDTTTFLVENSNKSDVFTKISNAVRIGHTVDGAFERSGTIRGFGKSGMTFVINILECDEGITIDIGGDVPGGNSNFGVLFDPTSAEGWALFGVVAAIQSVSSNSQQNSIAGDVQRLAFNILHALEATNILGFDDETVHRLTAGADVSNLEKGKLVIRRETRAFEAVAQRLSKISVIIDGAEMGSLMRGEELAFAFPPGVISVHVQGTSLGQKRNLEIKPGQTIQATCTFGAFGAKLKVL